MPAAAGVCAAASSSGEGRKRCMQSFVIAPMAGGCVYLRENHGHVLRPRRRESFVSRSRWCSRAATASRRSRLCARRWTASRPAPCRPAIRSSRGCCCARRHHHGLLKAAAERGNDEMAALSFTSSRYQWDRRFRAAASVPPGRRMTPRGRRRGSAAAVRPGVRAPPSFERTFALPAPLAASL